ncbi:hypothetical protein HMPREF9099_00215 [Lachnospiraceae bacterium oral taxon 082 str. F0431]|nr:hypothetical protein HMPREF9099_00215 [Lachnospiraceae bacterium oral taxon 082 str. F0431]
MHLYNNILLSYFSIFYCLIYIFYAIFYLQKLFKKSIFAIYILLSDIIVYNDVF